MSSCVILKKRTKWSVKSPIHCQFLWGFCSAGRTFYSFKGFMIAVFRRRKKVFFGLVLLFITCKSINCLINSNALNNFSNHYHFHLHPCLFFSIVSLLLPKWLDEKRHIQCGKKVFIIHRLLKSSHFKKESALNVLIGTLQLWDRKSSKELLVKKNPGNRIV